ncbi:NADP-dependent oxidoreductase [Aromatoleum toluclasticum]|uniref:NADP-dependent oxidoreductase n=1 Tax=Aromatoleum toluclasticum TaxID=92003 RepID=UPI000376356A|nr:NADP-dependent oxidoreductase [Aromatoleum toluclasticum]
MSRGENRQILLQRRPEGALREDDFALAASPMPEIRTGQFLLRNACFSLDAGFRKWMNAGADDNYLSAMALGAPVQSIVLGHVTESRHADFPVGSLVLARASWEEYSALDGSDFAQKLEHDGSFPLHEFVAALGPTGMTAYFGLLDVGRPRAGDTVLVSAAGGAVGSVVGQIAKILGCRTVGITSSPEKCRWLTDELGYDAAINHRDPAGLAAAMRETMPDGFDVYFDNVGGAMLDEAAQHMKLGARVVLCGAIADYDRNDRESGMFHMWQFIVKRATAAGFMFSDYVERYPEAVHDLSQWLRDGRLKSVVDVRRGIAQTPKAFCDMLSGATRGKCIVEL